MRASILLTVLPLAQAVRIVQSNDDGWAEINVRTLFDSLTAAGHNVVLSGPAEGKSGTGPLISYSFFSYCTDAIRLI